MPPGGAVVAGAGPPGVSHPGRERGAGTLRVRVLIAGYAAASTPSRRVPAASTPRQPGVHLPAVDNGRVDLDQLAALRTPEGSAALAAAAELAGGDPLAAAAALRAPGVPPALAAAALTQAELRRRAVGKFGPAAAGMFFTRAGLEQATRRVVADRRAARLRAAGVRTLADLGCGLGADALAAARAGIRVYGGGGRPGDRGDGRRQRRGGRAGRAVHASSAATRPASTSTGSTRSSAIRPGARRHRAAGLRPARLLAAVGLRHRAGRAGAAHRAKVAPGHRPRADAGRRRGRVGRRRRRPGRGRALVRPAGRGRPAGPPCCGGRRGALHELTGSRRDRGAGRAGRAATCTTRTRRWSARTWSPSWPPTGRDPRRPDASRTSTPTSRSARRTRRCLEITDVLPFSLKRLRALLRDRSGRPAWRSSSGARRSSPEQLRRDLRLSGTRRRAGAHPVAAPAVGRRARPVLVGGRAGRPVSLGRPAERHV